MICVSDADREPRLASGLYLFSLNHGIQDLAQLNHEGLQRYVLPREIAM
jgi:hypothetical protein